MSLGLLREEEQMQLPEGQREWGRRWAVALCAATLVVAVTCAAWAEPPKANAAAAGQPAATRPADPAAAGQDVDGLKRLIEEKMKQQGLDPTSRPADQPVRQPARPVRKVDTAQRASISPQVVTPPEGGEAATSQPAKGGCSGAAAGAVDLTPPPPDEPQPRWACLRQRRLEGSRAPPSFRTKKVDAGCGSTWSMRGAPEIAVGRWRCMGRGARPAASTSMDSMGGT